jgi:hypothetical protein
MRKNSRQDTFSPAHQRSESGHFALISAFLRVTGVNGAVFLKSRIPPSALPGVTDSTFTRNIHFRRGFTRPASDVLSSGMVLNFTRQALKCNQHTGHAYPRGASLRQTSQPAAGKHGSVGEEPFFLFFPRFMVAIISGAVSAGQDDRSAAPPGPAPLAALFLTSAYASGGSVVSRIFRACISR